MLHKVILSPGIITGGDWSTPVTQLQLETNFRNGLFLWTHVANVFGVAQSYLTTATGALFLAASQVLDGPQIDRMLLLFLYTFAGTSVFAYARVLGLHGAAALAAGTMYVATPVFFDYTAMGWGFVLLAFSFTPWVLYLFARCIRERRGLPPLTLAILFTIGFSFASQSLIWYPLAMVALAPFIVRSRIQFWRAARTLLLCGLVFVVLNLHWVLPLLRYGDPLLSSAASQSDVPLGQHLSVLNIMRGWGSLFNWPYEVAYPDSLLAFSLLPPVVGLSALVLRPHDWRARFLGVLTLIPLVFYILPSAFYELPFSGVIRDVGRFILFQALGSSLLIALTFDWILSRPVELVSRWQRYIPKACAAGLALCLLLSAYPVWAGELTGVSKQGIDIRLRTLTLSREYDKVERELADVSGSAKVLYFPTGIFLNLPLDSRFNGAYREFADPYATYAPRPGGIFDGDRRAGEYRAVASFLTGPRFISATSRLAETLGAMSIRWIVVRRDLQGHAYRTALLLQHLDTDDALIKRQDSDVVLYENPLALPNVYASITPVFQNTSVSAGLSTSFLDGFSKRRQVVFFRGAAYKMGNGKLIANIADMGNQMPSISFQRVNPTRWDIRVDDATGPFFLVLSETFDPRWRLEPLASGSNLPRSKDGDVRDGSARNDFDWSDASLKDPPSLPESAHFVANGYGNAWYIEPREGQTTLAFRAKFAPQSLAYVGAGVALTALVLLIGTCLFLVFRQGVMPAGVAVPITSTSNEDT